METTRRSKFRVAVMIATAASMVTLADGGPSAAASGASFHGQLAAQAGGTANAASDIRAKMLAQQPLVAAATEVRHAVDAAADAGFTGIALADHGVTLYWHGTPPASVMDAARRTRVPVDVIAAPHSLAELRAAAAVIDARMRADSASPINTISVPVDGTGLLVDTDGDMSTAARFLPAHSVPVAIRHRGGHGLASRYADRPPFWGGAAIINRNVGSRCTSGFGVVNNSGQQYLLTAGHCGAPGDVFVSGDKSVYVGQVCGGCMNVGHDEMLIPAPSADTVGPYIYDGGGCCYSSAGEFAKRVVGWNNVFPNEYVCQSGSTSGTICGIQNTNEFTFSYCGNNVHKVYVCLNDLVVGKKTDGGWALRLGDSGGPVFTLGSSANTVIAGGITSGWDTDIGCQWNVYCYLLYQDFATAASDFRIKPIGT